MFLPWIAELNFLSVNPETGVFLEFPVPTRRTIAKELCDVLLKGNTQQHLKSSAHVRVIMECVGQSFALPIDCADIIESATELYRRWFLEKENRPPPMNEDEETFFREMFRHFSLLFQPRETGKEKVAAHARLCSSVLELLQKVGREVVSRLTTHTREELLKILLGTTDSLLKIESGEQLLADKLCPLLLKVLFELFLRTETNNPKLWDALQALIKNWRHRRPTIIQWNVTSFALLQKVVRILFGTGFGTEHVTLTYDDGPSASIEISNEHAIYVWGRVMNLLGELEDIPNDGNYLEAMRGVSQLTQILLAKDKTFPPNVKIPDGNSILRILGNWLFKSINNYQQGYEKGKAQSLEALCTLYCSKNKTQFLPIYLASFYRGLEQAVKTKHRLLISVIMTNATTLFPCEFKGSRILIPSFMYALESVLLEPAAKPMEGITVPLVQLRKACIKILGCMICYPSQFAEILFKRKSPFPADSDLESYLQVNDHICKLLVDGLSNEDDVENRQLLLWTMVTYVFDSIHRDPQFPKTVITLILNKITAGSWNWEVILTAIGVLSLFAKIHPLFLSPDEPETSKQVVLTLCKFIEGLCSASGKKDHLEEMVVESFTCICDWIMVGQWLIKEPITLKSLFEVIDIGITGRKDKSQAYLVPTDKIKEAAEYVLVNLINLYAEFPVETGPTITSSLDKEQDIIQAKGMSDKSLTFVVRNNQTTLSLISFPRIEDVSVGVFVRDFTGRYEWNFRLNLFPPEKKAPVEPAETSTKILPSPLPLQEMDDDFLAELGGFLDEGARRMHEAVYKEAEDRRGAEDTHLNRITFGQEVEVQDPMTGRRVFRSKKEEQQTVIDSTPARLLLSHLGLYTQNPNYCVRSLQASFARPFRYTENYKTIDSMNSRETYAIGVVFLSDTANHASIYEQNDQGTPAYQSFLDDLGWHIDIEKHEGYLGVLEPGFCEWTPYHSDFNHEAVFHVSTLIPSTEVKRQIFTAQIPVLVTWVQNFEKWDASKSQTGEIVNILIQPLPSGLFRIRIVKKAGIGLFGPLLHDMVVSSHILGFAIRQTAINASKLLKNNSGNKPLTQRKAELNELIKRHNISLPFNKFYASQFSQV